MCLFGGARSGKTFLIVLAILLRAQKAPGSRHGIFRYRSNAVWASIAGDSNATIYTVNRIACGNAIKLQPHRMDGFFELENGSTIWLGGLDEDSRIDKILGREFSTVYLNEASEIPYKTATTVFTRLAEVRPEIVQRAYVDLNPVGKSHWTNAIFVRKVYPVHDEKGTYRPLERPETYACARLNPIDNIHNLSSDFISSLESLPEKQRRRFLDGVFVDEVEGALWTYDGIERNRVDIGSVDISAIKRLVVAVDPSGAASADDNNRDEIGIVVAGLGFDGHCYVLADRSLRASPQQWAQVAVAAYHEFKADRIIAEQNFGGAMVQTVIRGADQNVPVRLVTASRGKIVRAEPVSLRYEKGEVHHAGRFHILEDQLCAFSSAGYMGSGSPDHADAAIWAITDLLPGFSDHEIVIPFVTGQRRHNPFL